MASTREIEVETNTLQSDINELEEEIQAVRTLLETITSDMTELDAMWDGPANEVFMMQYGADAEYTEELCKVLEKLKECMEYAKKQYDSCEADISSMIASI